MFQDVLLMSLLVGTAAQTDKPTPFLSSVSHCLSMMVWILTMQHEKKKLTNKVAEVEFQRIFHGQLGKRTFGGANFPSSSQITAVGKSSIPGVRGMFWWPASQHVVVIVT